MYTTKDARKASQNLSFLEDKMEIWLWIESVDDCCCVEVLE